MCLHPNCTVLSSGFKAPHQQGHPGSMITPVVEIAQDGHIALLVLPVASWETTHVSPHEGCRGNRWVKASIRDQIEKDNVAGLKKPTV